MVDADCFGVRKLGTSNSWKQEGWESVLAPVPGMPSPEKARREEEIGPTGIPGVLGGMKHWLAVTASTGILGVLAGMKH